jgi:nickel-dependent lactate racemase
MHRNLNLPYGNRDLSFNLPSGWSLLSILAPLDPDPIKEPNLAIEKSLKNPVGCPSLLNLASNKKEAVIITDDKTRPTPTGKLIPVILGELKRAGIKEKDVTVIVGRGLHPKMTQKDIIDKLGKSVVDRVNVEDHDADSGCISLGRTSNNVTVSVNATLARSSLKIGLGSIFPHELLGYTGGSSIIVPGVASRETINRNHALVGAFDAEFGGIRGNLIRSDSEEAARITGLNFIVNVVLNFGDEIHSVHSGDLVAAHREGVTVSERTYGAKIGSLADVAIASSNPKTTTFGKGLKAVFAADLATKPGGTIILVSPCNEGISSSDVFSRMLLSNPGPEFLFKLLKEGTLPGESCVLYLFSLVKKRKKIILVSDGISQTEANKIGIGSAETIEDALAATRKKEGTVYAMPRGSVTLPIMES